MLDTVPINAELEFEGNCASVVVVDLSFDKEEHKINPHCAGGGLAYNLRLSRETGITFT